MISNFGMFKMKGCISELSELYMKQEDSYTSFSLNLLSSDCLFL